MYVSNRSLFAYKITRDYGFAPNPFFGICTLATCKPNIRKSAQVGDWVVGCGSEAEGSKLSGFLIYAMRVDEKLTFDKYWEDARYELKRPQMNGSLKVMYGDNIYHHDALTGEFVQEDSHHSYPDGVRNELNYRRDTQADAVLVSRAYWYWGGEAVPIPPELGLLRGLPRGYRRFRERDHEGLIEKLEAWLSGFDESGYMGRPAMFGGGFRRYSGK